MVDDLEPYDEGHTAAQPAAAEPQDKEDHHTLASPSPAEEPKDGGDDHASPAEEPKVSHCSSRINCGNMTCVMEKNSWTYMCLALLHVVGTGGRIDGNVQGHCSTHNWERRNLCCASGFLRLGKSSSSERLNSTCL